MTARLPLPSWARVEPSGELVADFGRPGPLRFVVALAVLTLAAVLALFGVLIPQGPGGFPHVLARSILVVGRDEVRVRYLVFGVQVWSTAAPLDAVTQAWAGALHLGDDQGTLVVGGDRDALETAAVMDFVERCVQADRAGDPRPVAVPWTETPHLSSVPTDDPLPSWFETNLHGGAIKPDGTVGMGWPLVAIVSLVAVLLGGLALAMPAAFVALVALVAVPLVAFGGGPIVQESLEDGSLELDGRGAIVRSGRPWSRPIRIEAADVRAVYALGDRVVIQTHDGRVPVRCRDRPRHEVRQVAEVLHQHFVGAGREPTEGQDPAPPPALLRLARAAGQQRTRAADLQTHRRPTGAPSRPTHLT